MPHAVSSSEQLSALIERIHDVPLAERGWEPALVAIERAFQARSATFFRQDAQARLLEFQSQDPGDPIARDYGAYYGQLDRLRPAVSQAPAGTVLTHDMVHPWAEFQKTEMYADFAVRHDTHHCIQARFDEGAGQSGSYIAVSRSDRAGAFGAEDVRLTELLLPHLRTAARMRTRLAAVELQRDMADAALDELRSAIFVTDSTGRILLANRAAEDLLRASAAVGVAPGRRLRAAQPSQTEALRRLIAAAAIRGGRGGALRLDCAEEGWLAVFASPLGEQGGWGIDREPAAMLLIEQPQIPSPLGLGVLRALFGLTRAEAAVARLIARGEGVDAAAPALGVAPTTLRWHLRRVFEKTDTRRQAELARLLARLESLAPGRGGGPEG